MHLVVIFSIAASAYKHIFYAGWCSKKKMKKKKCTTANEHVRSQKLGMWKILDCMTTYMWLVPFIISPRRNRSRNGWGQI